jgi:hypothetical protein
LGGRYNHFAIAVGKRRTRSSCPRECVCVRPGSFQVAFAATAGNLAATSGNTGEVQIWFHKSGWTNYTQTNDPSFDATKTAYADWNRVTLYQNGTLVWGTEP